MARPCAAGRPGHRRQRDQELGLAPTRQTAVDTAEAAEQIDVEGSGPALRDPWAFAQAVLGWEARHIAGAPGGSEIPVSLVVPLPEHNTSLQPTWAVLELGDGAGEWQLLVRVEDAGVDPDQRASLDGVGGRRRNSGLSASCVKPACSSA